MDKINSAKFDKLIFHHLTKTAGTSLISELKKCGFSSFDNARYDFEWNQEAFENDQFSFFHGHYTFDKVSEIVEKSDKNIMSFTFIRNPIDRVISQFHNWKNVEKTKLEAETIASRNKDQKFISESSSFGEEISKMSLTDFLQSNHPKIIDSKFNHQTRYLSSLSHRNISTEQALQNAKFNLLRFYDFFGVKELYNMSCRILEKELGIPQKSLNSENRVNLNSKKSFKDKYIISKKEFDLLVKYNLLDLKLFEFAVGVFIAKHKLETKPNLENMIKSFDSGYSIKT